MPTGFPIVLTEETELAIINYYLNDHSIGQTTKFFGFTNKRIVTKVLNKYSITRHTKEKLTAIRVRNNVESCVKKYGVANVSQLNEIKLKKQKTSLHHYGTLNTIQAACVKEKIKKSNMQKYGVPYTLQLEQVRDKAKQTKLKRYGNANYVNSEQYKKTCLEKYGVENYSMTKEFHSKKQTRYEFNNERFDSFPELCFYLYHYYNNIKIIHLPTKILYYYNNKKHYYFPDFQVNNRLIEIKSDYLFSKMQIKDTVSNAKYNCMVANNVQILLENDYQFYINWFNSNNFISDNYKIKIKINNKINHDFVV